MAWSPYKETVISYVSEHLGCSKWDVASLCTRSSRRCPSKQYYIVNTAIRNRWIGGRMVGRQYRLYVMTPDVAAKLRERRERNRPVQEESLAQRLIAYKAMLARRRREQERRAAEAFREAMEAAKYEAAVIIPPGRITFTTEGGWRTEQI